MFIRALWPSHGSSGTTQFFVLSLTIVIVILRQRPLWGDGWQMEVARLGLVVAARYCVSHLTQLMLPERKLGTRRVTRAQKFSQLFSHKENVGLIRYVSTCFYWRARRDSNSRISPVFMRVSERTCQILSAKSAQDNQEVSGLRLPLLDRLTGYQHQGHCNLRYIANCNKIQSCM